MERKNVDILLVEDEPAHAEAVRRAFDRKRGQVNVRWASTLKEALARLAESVPDIVIADWMLPDGKGTDILPTEKKHRRFPVVLMTSHGNEQIAVHAMKAGVSDYVVKSPIMFADMPHVAERVLKQWDMLIERQISEEKLRESEERFRTVFEQGPLGMHIAGLDYRFVALNDAFCQIVGYCEEELGNLTFADITYPDDLEPDMVQAQRLLTGEIQSYKMEKRHIKKQGEIVWLDVTRSMIRGAGGNPLHFLTMVEDITERKHTEQLLRIRAEDLARSNEDLEQFAYVASHDLQEPLRNVANCMQILETRNKAKLDDDSTQLMYYAVESVKRMKALITDLLAYSRISTRGKPFQETNSQAIMKESLRNLEFAISQQGAQVTNDPLPLVHADPTQLLQVFQNLIANAVQFHRDEPPKIHVSAQKKGSEWIFSVNDNGIGIEARHLDRIFVIFQQLEKGRRFHGTGMGLAIVKKILERHRGRVWAESQVGVGSTFYFAIPDGLESNP